MGKLSNIIFYKDSWGTRNVIKKMAEVENIPSIGEVVVVSDIGSYYTVIERVFDFEDSIVHLRLNENPRTYDLAYMDANA